MNALSAALVKSLPLFTSVSLCEMAIAAGVGGRGGPLVSAGGRKALSLPRTRARPPLRSLESARDARGGQGAGGEARGPVRRAAPGRGWEARGGQRAPRLRRGGRGARSSTLPETRPGCGR